MQSIEFRHTLIAMSCTAVMLALSLLLTACSEHPTTTTSADSASTSSATPATISAPPATSATTTPAASATENEKDEADENGAPAAKVEKTFAPSDKVHRGPRVKGIQLGDSLEDVKHEFSALLNNPACTVYDASQSLGAGIYAGICNSDGVILAAMTFVGGRLSILTFGSALVNQTFGSLPSKVFVQNFMSAYSIPDMNPEDGPNNELRLAYRDRSGWEADVFPDNSFTLKTTDTAAQQASRFN